ncbi:MAG: hypothetical protein Q7K43_05715 [Candidatus Woesearchaeota archaeon]|nr:hypothetical protein [Candidatus Woesearchaeota archaeon]
MDWIQKGMLVTEEEWHSHIAHLHAQVKESIAEKESLLKYSETDKKVELKQALVSAINSRIPKERFGGIATGSSSV